MDLELLRDGDARDEAADFSFDVGVFSADMDQQVDLRIDARQLAFGRGFLGQRLLKVEQASRQTHVNKIDLRRWLRFIGLPPLTSRLQPGAAESSELREMYSIVS
jgi:hypothetical protein